MNNLTDSQKNTIFENAYKSGDKLYFRSPRGIIIRLTEKPPNKKQRNKLRKAIYKELVKAKEAYNEQVPV